MGQTVINQLLVELDARTTALDQKLAGAEGKIRGVGGAAAKTGGDAAAMGQRVAAASVQIAGAAEQAARAGRVTGEAAKQVLVQGSNIAFMFGPAGAIAGAVAVLTLATVEYFQGVRREMEETEKRSREFQRRIRGQTLGANVDEQTRLFGGDELAESEAERRGVARLRAERARLQREIAALGANTAGEGAAAIEARNARNSALSRELERVKDLLAEIEPRYAQLGARVALQTGEAVDTTQARIDADAAEKAAAAGKRAAAQTKDRAADAAKLADELRELNAVATLTAVDDLQLGIDRLREKFKDATGATREQADAYVALQERVRDLTGESEQLEAALAQIRRLNDAGAVTDLAAVRELDARLDAEQANLKGAKTDAERKVVQERIAKLQAEIARLQEKTEQRTRAAAAAAGAVESRTAQVAGRLADAANFAFGLASALLGADSAAAKLLGSVGQVAGGVAGVAKLAKDAGGLGALFSTGKGLASALPGLGAVVGGALAIGSALFGDSPAEQERKRIQRENTAAIVRLTNRVGDLAKITTTGTDRATFLDILRRTDAVTNENGLLGRAKTTVTLQQQLKAAGLTMDELRDFAREYGIELGTEISDRQVDQLLAAMGAAEETEFGDDFAGRVDRFRAEVALLGDAMDEPSEQLAAYRRALDGVKNGGGLLAQTLKTFDLTTAEGVEQARAALQELFQRLPTLTDAELGGLSGQDFLAALQDLMGIVDAAAGGGGISGTGGYAIDRSITEVTGSRLAGLLTTSNVWLEQIAAATAATAVALGASIPAPIVPPAVGPGVAGSGGSGPGDTTITIAAGAVVVYVTAAPGTTPAQAEATGRAVGAAAADAIGREQAAEIERRRRSSGAPTRV